MDSPYDQEDLRPLINIHSVPSSPNPGLRLVQDTDYAVVSKIIPVSPASLPSYRSQYTPYLDSPHNSCTSPGWPGYHNVDRNSKSIFQKSSNSPFENDGRTLDVKSSTTRGVSGSKQSSTDNCWLRSWRCIRSAFSDCWLIEYLCALGSLACLFAIWIILKQKNTHALPHWPHDITLNTVVAALATLAKALMAISVAACLGQLKWTHFSRTGASLADFDTFDSASRGGLGTLSLLFKPKGRFLAALGAVIMVAAFPLSPITQQAISTSQSWVNNGTAMVSQAQNYTYNVENGMNEDENDMPYLDGSAIGAFYTGLYASYDQSFPYPTATCPTGNCTWPPYRSLGVCTQLADLTSQLKSTPGNDCTDDDCTNPTMFVLPNGLFIGGRTRLNVTSLPLKPQELLEGSEVQSLKTIAFPHVHNRAADIILMYNYESTIARAYEAVFYYCIQDFSTNFTNGVLQTSIDNIWADDSNSNGPELFLDQKPNITLTAPDEPRLYTVHSPSVWAIRNFTNQVMTGQVTFDGVATYTTDVARAFSLLGGVLVQDKEPATPPQQTINGRLALEVVMENIARSLSNNIQTNTYPNTTEPFYGTAYSWQTTVHVRWLWLIPISAYVCLGFIFLYMTVYQNRCNMPKWKTSSLPVLQALDNSTRRDLSGGLEYLSEMERRAEELQVTLEKRNGEWRLVRNRTEEGARQCEPKMGLGISGKDS